MTALQRSKKRIIVFSGIGVLVLALVILVILGSKRETIVPVQVEKVQRRTITQIVTASGKIQPEVSVNISAEVSGEIIALPVKEGARVRKGDVLVRIKPDLYIAAVNQASASYNSARASLEKAQSDYERVRQLYAKKLVSESDLQAAKTAYDVAKAQADQFKAALERAKEDLAKTSIYSPLDGTVSKLNSELGERVVGTGLMGGTVIMTVADLTKMEAIVDVSENDVVLVEIGDTAIIEVDALPGKKLKGIVKEIANTATTTGLGTQQEIVNFPVKIRVLDRIDELRPGMSVTADIRTETKNDVVAVPIQCVTTRMLDSTGASVRNEVNSDTTSSINSRRHMEKPKEVVFVVEHGKAKAVPVERGISDESYVEITKGLQGGEEVVVGSYKAINRDLENGVTVKIEKARAPARGS